MNQKSPILLAEDDDNDVFFFKRAAREANLANPIHVARDGQETVEYILGAGIYSEREVYPLPCLLILDLKMPRKTGLEVLQWLRKESPLITLPVIVFSSSAQPDDIERAYRLGANSFVVKPPSIDKRAEFARMIKQFWLTFHEPPAHCPRESTLIIPSLA
jgi:CheY-like chemotaxis protein